MTCYLDTSAFLALFDPRNPHHDAVQRWYERAGTPRLAYNRLLQVEARHYFNRLTHDYAATARQAHLAAEKMRAFDWQTTNLTTLLQQAEVFSRTHAGEVPCGFWDLCHVIAAEEFPFVTCDGRQAAAARLAGLKTTLLKAV